jgi:amino-acid N-acetyltransferase
MTTGDTAPTIELATPADLSAVEQLLAASQLPLDGVRECLEAMLVARRGGRVVGSAALEFFQSAVLLRSLAVAAEYRGRGLGEALTEAALVLARSKGATAAYLLTTTAADFFPRFGFERIERAEAPDAVRQSIEFTSACPSSAVAMRARLTGHIW